MTILDIILLLCFVPALIDGIRKGFLRQIFGIIGIAAGACLGVRKAGLAGSLLTEWFPSLSKEIAVVIAFILIFVLCCILADLLGKLFSKMMHIATLGWANKIIGIAFSLLKTLLALAVLVWIFEGINSKLGLVPKNATASSKVYTYIKKVSDKTIPSVSKIIEDNAKNIVH